jgi:hypothetical protein
MIMSRSADTQLNVRSRFARDRASLLSKQTGMSATQVVEEALRSYVPQVHRDVPTKLVRKGTILVRPTDGKRISLVQANAVLEEDRDERL